MKKIRESVRRKIVFAARQVIAEQGLLAFRYSDIAKQAQISMGTLYSHYANKEALVISMFIMRLDILVDLQSRVAQAAMTPYEKLITHYFCPIFFSRHHQQHNELNFLFSNPSIWMRAEDTLQLRLRAGFDAMKAVSATSWSQALEAEHLLTDEAEIMRQSYTLLSYQRGTVLMFQNPMAANHPKIEECLQTIDGLLRQLNWQEGTTGYDVKKIVTFCRTALDQYDSSLI
ncbi:TetR/AcrR family transcriptional regulator [Ferrimonas pelagia]|uniref:HTH tetR-type domain-containing protein n=1 Tax=Ferrimonas pelagia TaxID=1177826 RepID=A0ABP9EKM0_9GAMM